MENKKPRRKLTSQFKSQVVLEYLKGSKSQAEICRQNAISPSLFAKWCRQFQENVHKIFEDFRNSDSQAEQVAKLEQIIGKQTIEIDFLKEARGRIGLWKEDRLSKREHTNNRLPFQRKCQLLSLNRNTAYYQLNGSKSEEKEAEDLAIKDEIDKIQLEFPYYGYRSVTAALRRQGRLINRKKVQRIMRKYGLLSQIKRLFRSFTKSKHKLLKYPNLIRNLAITTINQVWGADITYIRLKREFVYLAVIIDFYSRKIKGWALSKDLDASLTVEALKKALSRNPKPAIHHSDQGVQYCDKEYVEILKEASVLISMSDKGNPYQNNITESFFKTLKYNEVYLNEYDSFEEAFSNIEKFIEVVYQKKRFHSSLGYLPPEEFEAQVLAGQHQKVEQQLTLTIK